MLLSWLTNDDDDCGCSDDDDDDNEKQVSYIVPIVRMTSLFVPVKGLCMCFFIVQYCYAK